MSEGGLRGFTNTAPRILVTQNHTPVRHPSKEVTGSWAHEQSCAKLQKYAAAFDTISDERGALYSAASFAN